MRKKNAYVTYLMSLTLGATLILSAGQPSSSDIANASAVSAATTAASAAASSASSTSTTVTATVSQQPILIDPLQPMLSAITAAQVEVTLEEVTVEEPKVEVKPLHKHYVTNTYSLNVRKWGDPRSTVIGSLEQDEPVIITSKTDNGWFKLATGGYVNGKYLTKINKAWYEPKLEAFNTQKAKEAEARKIAAQQKEAAAKKAAQAKKTAPKVTSKTTAASAAVVYTERTGSVVNPVTHGVGTPSNLSLEEINMILEGTELESIGSAVYNVERQHGVNALFTIAVAKLESGNGTSRIARHKNNLFGLNAIDGDAFNKAYSYGTMSDSVYAFGDIIDRIYVSKGHDSLIEINPRYSSSSEWKHKVAEIIAGDLRKI